MSKENECRPAKLQKCELLPGQVSPGDSWQGGTLASGGALPDPPTPGLSGIIKETRAYEREARVTRVLKL